ncbi:MAG: heme ABC transporter permease [Rickettsiales bacterium]|nr:heme ABC transporter permease [Pseudomonadota bacterium]MDA0966956.1 heme ABC transporter permease [Pseudomonadota bacterium]MDG4543875.1 heme ABC transporter permease [Rickettsiales bacterium]MDG4546021.1 heme ABC transporter permease [Rickettsiales bacterium]MDG4548267.1 heme ABC transporter permease [Rickettsiales bacterium]
MHKYFNPGKFGRIADRVLPFSAGLTAILMISGLYCALIGSPPDYQQGESVRIMYIHVPAATMALGVYTFIALVCAASLIWKNPLSDMIAISSAPIGAGFTIICLITGSLWGKPIWGTWWVWDARLTSVLILLFFYLGYMALYNAYDDRRRAGQTSAILALVGFINVPIVKFSVDWWNTLHQPASIVRMGGPKIDPSMMTPLIIMFFAFISFFITVLILRIKVEILSLKQERLNLGK